VNADRRPLLFHLPAPTTHRDCPPCPFCDPFSTNVVLTTSSYPSQPCPPGRPSFPT